MPTISKFEIELDEILRFVFPQSLQHPMAAARLVVYGNYGPLHDGQLLTGPRGRHALTSWELDAMCIQIEREDIMQIYLHKNKSFGLLNKAEQESLINQADGHLKSAKGRAMLPNITDLPRNPDTGLLSFHDVQNKIETYRQQRIQQYKLVFPLLKNTSNNNSKDLIKDQCARKERISQKLKEEGKHLNRVSPYTANSAMFEKMEGETNADVNNTNQALLSQHAYKICYVDSANESSLNANVRLLREVEPKFHDPASSSRVTWSNTCNVRGTQLGSLVKAVPSSSTWKRKVTL